MAQSISGGAPDYGIHAVPTTSHVQVAGVVTTSNPGGVPDAPVSTDEATTSHASGYLSDPGWVFGLCSCFSHCPEALDAACCSYCSLSQQYDKLMYGRTNAINWPVCSITLLLDTFVTGGLLRCFLMWYLREKIQDRYGIRRNGCVSGCTVFFCSCCAQVQQHLEMTSRGDWPGSVCCGLQPGYVQADGVPSTVVLQ